MRKGKEFTVVYDNVPKKVEIGKRKKRTYYISFNAIYSSPHHTVRTSIMDTLKAYFATKMDLVPVFTKPISIEYTFYCKRRTFDVANKIALLDKCYCDLLKAHGKIVDDNVTRLTSVKYSYAYRDNIEDQLIIKIS